MTDLISRQEVIDKLKVAYCDKNLQSAKNDPCVIDAMTDWAIRQVKEVPADNSWHTGKPTEIKGWFLFKYRAYGKFVYRTVENPVIDIFADSELEWQKIEERE